MFLLKMISFNGMNRTLAAGSFNEMQHQAKKVRERHDGEINTLVPQREWELEDPGTRMICDSDGYLKIVKDPREVPE